MYGAILEQNIHRYLQEENEINKLSVNSPHIQVLSQIFEVNIFFTLCRIMSRNSFKKELN